MYQILLLCTFIGLIIFFVAMEIYRWRTMISGTLIGVYPSALGIEEYLVSRLKVQLPDGKIVEAEAMSCTLCLARYSIGDQVKLVKFKDKYSVFLPFFSFEKKWCRFD